MPLGHLLTFGGHPVAAAAALKNLEIFERRGSGRRGAETGVYLKERLEELRGHIVGRRCARPSACSARSSSSRTRRTKTQVGEGLALHQARQRADASSAA